MTKKRRGPSAQQEKIHLTLEPIQALTKNQHRALTSGKNLLLKGAAGTGKTFLASYLAYNSLFNKRAIKRVIYYRSAVATRNQGFYPGTEEEKMAVYEAPYIGIARTLFTRGDAYAELKKKRLVEFRSTSHERGVTIDDAVIIVDEAQNLSFHELDTIITRAGENVRIILCGDTEQADLPARQSGLKEFEAILNKMESFDTVTFGIDDIVRGGLCKEYLLAKYQG